MKHSQYLGVLISNLRVRTGLTITQISHPKVTMVRVNESNERSGAIHIQPGLPKIIAPSVVVVDHIADVRIGIVRQPLETAKEI